MIYFNEVTGENTQEQNPYWSRVPVNPYRTLIVGGFGSGKINALLSITGHQANIYKILLYAKNPY